MKPFKFFRAVLALVHLVLLSLIFFAVVFLFYILAGGGINYPIEISPEITLLSEASLLTVLIFFIVITGGYFYFFTILRNLAQSMGEKLFTQEQVEGFKRAGSLIILLTLIENIFAFIVSLIFHGLDTGISFSDLVLFSGFGCFLLVLGEVFARGKVYKEENELTV